MQQPIDDLVASIANTLDAKQREAFEERAGIMQFDAGLPRAHAECLALLDILHRQPSATNRIPTATNRSPAALSGVSVLEVELDGATQWVVTTNLHFARRHLQDMGGIELEECALSKVVETQYGGMAMLTTIG